MTEHNDDAAQPESAELVEQEDDSASIAAQVEQPAKVMRIGTMIKQLLEEVRAAPLDEAGRARLREIHDESAPTTGLEAVVVPVDPPARRKPRWPMYAGAAGVAAGVVVTSAFLLRDNGSLPAPVGAQPPNVSTTQSGTSDKPLVTATRVNPQTLRFTWTYAGARTGDKFVWRTNDELKTGTVDVASIELSASGTLCVEVRVVRADGSNANDQTWSPEGCGF